MKSFRVPILCAAMFAAIGGKARAQQSQETDGANKLRLAVEAAPGDIKTHQAYIKAMKFDSPELIKQYDAWIKKYPQSAIFPYAIGNALSNRENPAAKPYLKKAVEVKPDYAAAYYAMAGDAERWGQFDSAFFYLKKATEIEPENADYAFRYAFADGNKMDKEKFRNLVLKIAKDFPGTSRGSQALYWLGNRLEDPNEKMQVYEQQKKEFPAGKFDWTLYGMGDYFNILLPDQPQKALTLAEEMIRAVPANDSYAKQSWEANISMAKNVIQINALLSKGKKAEAVGALKNISAPKRGELKAFFTFYKSKVLAATGNHLEAYRNMLAAYAKEPSAKMQELLMVYAKNSGYLEKKAEEDWWYIRDTAARQAPVFNLYNYFTQTNTALSDYRGKVVLLTYWFPGCGPCRGEFPHFENVVRKFKDRKDFVYVGINIAPEQDEYVVPFLKSSGYSFIPLRDNENWKKGPLDNRGMAPMNFLIDGDGRIMFDGFRTDLHNEGSLEMMIGALLNRQKEQEAITVEKGKSAFIKGNIHLKQPAHKIHSRYYFEEKWWHDSTRIVNGGFEFRVPVSEPIEVELFLIVPKKNASYPEYQTVKVFTEPGNTIVSIKDTITNITVTGSKAQEEIEKIEILTKDFSARRSALFAEMRQLHADKKNTEETEAKFNREHNQIRKEELEAVYRPYLLKHPGSPIATEVLMNYIGNWVQVDYEVLVEAEKLFDGFTTEVKDTYSGRDLIRRIRSAKNVSVGAMAVDFTLKDSSDNPVSLSSFRGKYVLIDFWASWCVPCRANNPRLVKAYNNYKDRGFTVLGVAFDGGERLEKAWRKAMVTDGLPWVNVNDIAYPAHSSVGKQYNVGSVPQNVLVDPSGKIIARNIEGDVLERELEKILAKQ